MDYIQSGWLTWRLEVFQSIIQSIYTYKQYHFCYKNKICAMLLIFEILLVTVNYVIIQFL